VRKLQAFFRRLLGLREVRLDIGIKTQFRGRKNQLYLPEWQEIAEVFKKTPDLEDYWRSKLEEIEYQLRLTPITSDGDRRRLVLQAQAEVLQDCLRLPEIAAAKVRVMMQPKPLPKGNEYAPA
jgi:hypothetical protein